MNAALLLLVASVAAAQPSAEPKEGYFPAGTLAAFETSWFTRHLKAMGEKPLRDATPTGSTAWRLTVLPTWGNPVMVRLVDAKGERSVEARRLDGAGGYEPGRIAESSVSKPEPEAVAEFKSRFDALGFPKLPSSEELVGKDGSEWILESVADGRYHVVVRWSPGTGTEERGLAGFRDVCERLYQMGPLKGAVTNKGAVLIRRPPPER